MKNYICQLGDGKMVVLEDDIIKIETTGYPMPDCSLDVGKAILGQANVLKTILGYDILNLRAFIQGVNDLEGLSLNDWKLKIQSEDIGGGCPANLKRIANYILSGYTELQSFFLALLPESVLTSELDLTLEFPDDDYLEDNSKLLMRSINVRYDERSMFRQPFLFYKNIKNLDEKFASLVVEAVKTIGNPTITEDLKYLTTISSKSGIGCVLLFNDTEGCEEFQYFYWKILGISPADCNITVNLDGNNVELSFKCIDECQKSYYENKPKFKGTFKRYYIGNGLLEEL